MCEALIIMPQQIKNIINNNTKTNSNEKQTTAHIDRLQNIKRDIEIMTGDLHYLSPPYTVLYTFSFTAKRKITLFSSLEFLSFYY